MAQPMLAVQLTNGEDSLETTVGGPIGDGANDIFMARAGERMILGFTTHPHWKAASDCKAIGCPVVSIAEGIQKQCLRMYSINQPRKTVPSDGVPGPGWRRDSSP